MVEPEIAYATLDDVVTLAEKLVATIVNRVLENRRRELAVLERDTSPLEQVHTPFPRVSYDEAVEILKDRWPSVRVGRRFRWNRRDRVGRTFPTSRSLFTAFRAP